MPGADLKTFDYDKVSTKMSNFGEYFCWHITRVQGSQNILIYLYNNYWSYTLQLTISSVLKYVFND